MEPLPQLGPQHFASWGQVGRGAAVPESPSLGSGRVNWGEPLLSPEEEGTQRANLSRPRCLRLVLPGSEGVTHRVCLLPGSRRNLSSNALESLSWKTVQGLPLQEL